MTDAREPWHLESTAPAATPVDEDERHDMKLSWVATRSDLDGAEAANIARALAMPRWARLSTEGWLDDLVLRDLHKAMFGGVWRWAGKYRTTEKNIGCDPAEIAIRVRELCGNARFWFFGGSSGDEAACRLHHTLVAIHPFVNGNRRHARAVTDFLLRSTGADSFTWGRRSMTDPSVTRTKYVAALRAADRGDLDALIRFARS